MNHVLLESCIARVARRTASFVVAGLVSVTSAAAHDFWIVPSSFQCEPGARVSIDLQVGERWKGEAVTRNSERIARFVAVHADGHAELIQGIDGKAPAGFLRPTQSELVTLAYVSRPTSIELAAEKFEAYLAAEGLERVSEIRKQRGESQTKGTERYSRSVKSLIRVGAGSDRSLAVGAGGEKSPAIGGSGFDRELGLPLEILVERDPYATHAGDDLWVRVEFGGKPLANALVGCAAKTDPEHEQRVRTDDNGRVKLELATSGPWMVRVVHMIPAPSDAGVDWESYWASLTFELPAAEAPRAN